MSKIFLSNNHIASVKKGTVTLRNYCQGEELNEKRAICACVWQFSAILLWRIQDHRSPPVTSLLAVDVATTYHPVRPLRTQHRRWRGIRNWWVLVKTNLATCHGYLNLDSQIMYDPYVNGILNIIIHPKNYVAFVSNAIGNSASRLWRDDSVLGFTSQHETCQRIRNLNSTKDVALNMSEDQGMHRKLTLNFRWP